MQNRGPVCCWISRTYREWTYSLLIGQYFIGQFYWWVGFTQSFTQWSSKTDKDQERRKPFSLNHFVESNTPPLSNEVDLTFEVVAMCLIMYQEVTAFRPFWHPTFFAVNLGHFGKERMFSKIFIFFKISRSHFILTHWITNIPIKKVLDRDLIFTIFAPAFQNFYAEKESKLIPRSVKFHWRHSANNYWQFFSFFGIFPLNISIQKFTFQLWWRIFI